MLFHGLRLVAAIVAAIVAAVILAYPTCGDPAGGGGGQGLRGGGKVCQVSKIALHTMFAAAQQLASVFERTVVSCELNSPTFDAWPTDVQINSLVTVMSGVLGPTKAPVPAFPCPNRNRIALCP